MVQSCTNEQEPIISGSNKTETTISHMIVKFEGKVYETDVTTIGDSVVYLNKEFAEIYISRIA